MQNPLLNKILIEQEVHTHITLANLGLSEFTRAIDNIMSGKAVYIDIIPYIRKIREYHENENFKENVWQRSL